MSLLENFNLVYGTDMRVLDPSVEVNAVTGIGPQFHLEPFHTMRWVGQFEGSTSVVADNQSFAYRGHKTETMIPHLPIPPWPIGAPLLRTIFLDSKCHIYCYHPDLEVQGKKVGVAMLGLAPPFHCASLKVPANLGKLGSLVDKLPGVSKIKGALGQLHEVNEKLAKIDAFSQGLAQVLEGARVAQVLGAAAMDLFNDVDGLETPQDTTNMGNPGISGEKAHPFEGAQEMLRADADYQKARLSLAQGDKAGVSYYQSARELESIRSCLHQRKLLERAELQESQDLARTNERLDRDLSTIETEIASQDRSATRHQVAKQFRQRRARLGIHPQADLDQGHRDIADKQHALRAKCRQMRAQKERNADQLRRLRASIKRHQARSQEDRERQATLRASQQADLARLAPSPTHKQLGVMLPSLTSFSASFMQHSVKLGMRPSSYWNMQLKVLAIALSDIIDHAIGLVGDALLVDGPSSRVGSWVAELGAGALQGVVGTPIRAWGHCDRLDFSVPIKSGSLVAGGLVQARAEFYWSLSDLSDPENKDGDKAQYLASRSGFDLPGRTFDAVQVLNASTGPGVEFTVPPVW